MSRLPIRALARPHIATGMLLLGLAGNAAAQMPPASVTVAPVRFEELAPTISLPGTVISRDNSRVAANVAGTVRSIAEVGDVVAAGEPLAQLDEADALDSRREAENAVAALAARIEFLSAELRRLTRLAAQNIAAQSQLEDTRSQLDMARADHSSAQARLERMRRDVRRTSVLAPFTGVVTERNVNQGEAVALGGPVARLVGSQRLEVSVSVPVSNALLIQPGDMLTVVGHRARIEGAVRTRFPAGAGRSNMYELRVTVPPENFAINEDVRVEVPAGSAQASLVVPRDALVLRREGTSVYRVTSEGTAEAVAVTTGAARGADISVEGPLEAGDQVVIRGAERLRPGQNVNIVALPGVGGA